MVVIWLLHGCYMVVVYLLYTTYECGYASWGRAPESMGGLIALSRSMLHNSEAFLKNPAVPPGHRFGETFHRGAPSLRTSASNATFSARTAKRSLSSLNNADLRPTFNFWPHLSTRISQTKEHSQRKQRATSSTVSPSSLTHRLAKPLSQSTH